MSGYGVMPSTDELRRLGALLALQGAHMELRSEGLTLVGLTPSQRENVIVAWVGAWSAEWARLDCPTLELTTLDTGLLMSTVVPAAVVEVRPPAPFWLIEVPPLIVVRNGLGELDHVTRLLCMHMGGLWSYTALASVCELRCWQQSLEEMRLGAPGRDNDSRLRALPCDELDLVAYKQMARIVINSAAQLRECNHPHFIAPEGEPTRRVCGVCGKGMDRL